MYEKTRPPALGAGFLLKHLPAGEALKDGHAAELSGVLPWPDKFAPQATEKETEKCIGELLSEEFGSLIFEPPLHRPPPPLFECHDLETIWMNPPEVDHKPIWDHSMGVDNTRGMEVRTMMKKAFISSLGLQQQQFVLAEIEKDSKLVYHIGLTPEKVRFVSYSPYTY